MLCFFLLGDEREEKGEKGKVIVVGNMKKSYGSITTGGASEPPRSTGAVPAGIGAGREEPSRCRCHCRCCKSLWNIVSAIISFIPTEDFIPSDNTSFYTIGCLGSLILLSSLIVIVIGKLIKPEEIAVGYLAVVHELGYWIAFLSKHSLHAQRQRKLPKIANFNKYIKDVLNKPFTHPSLLLLIALTGYLLVLAASILTLVFSSQLGGWTPYAVFERSFHFIRLCTLAALLMECCCGLYERVLPQYDVTIEADALKTVIIERANGPLDTPRIQKKIKDLAFRLFSVPAFRSDPTFGTCTGVAFSACLVYLFADSVTSLGFLIVASLPDKHNSNGSSDNHALIHVFMVTSAILSLIVLLTLAAIVSAESIQRDAHAAVASLISCPLIPLTPGLSDNAAERLIAAASSGKSIRILHVISTSALLAIQLLSIGGTVLALLSQRG